MREINDSLPGADLIREGLDDLARGVESIPALLVLVGAPRMRRLGFDVADTPYFPEDRLYEQLATIYGDAAHSKYNALIRTLVSFERAVACVSR
ncbi:MAG TPA: hypothetical protein VNA69_02340 [Thermoanaerobaculia bacterium]|nr:hypothetical protein [Thermoanaerobaculia bacterium]